MQPVETVHDSSVISRLQRGGGDIQQAERLKPKIKGREIVNVGRDQKHVFAHVGPIVAQRFGVVKDRSGP